MYKPSRLLSSFYIAGFKYWDGALILDKLSIGNELQLVTESDNPHDPSAIAVLFSGVKLGYIPADENKEISIMMFYGHQDVFEARVLQIDKQAAPWKQVLVGLYVREARSAEV